jgi:hypothetical protein
MACLIQNTVTTSTSASMTTHTVNDLLLKSEPRTIQWDWWWYGSLFSMPVGCVRQ